MSDSEQKSEPSAEVALTDGFDWNYGLKWYCEHTIKIPSVEAAAKLEKWQAELRKRIDYSEQKRSTEEGAVDWNAAAGGSDWDYDPKGLIANENVTLPPN